MLNKIYALKTYLLTFLYLIISSSALILSNLVFALPDDEFQAVQVSADRHQGDLDMANGIQTLYGSEQSPAVITKGSIIISGISITLERKDGELQKVTASGNPARFQQQPEIDQDIIYGSGETLVFDNSRQILSIDAQAQLLQGKSSIKAHHIDYDMVKRIIDSRNNGDGDQIEMVIPPTTNP